MGSSPFGIRSSHSVYETREDRRVEEEAWEEEAREEEADVPVVDMEGSFVRMEPAP